VITTINARRDHEATKTTKDHEENKIFFVSFRALRVFVVAF